jgi:general secretion pathway protein I
MKKAGFTLLEVILALAILGGAIAVLGEISRMALRNAAITRDLAHAQMLCETVMANIVTGIIPAEATESTPIDETMTDSIDPDETWNYTIEINDTDEPGLISARVTVTHNAATDKHPLQFALVRWVPDPNATTSSQSGSTSGGSTSTTSPSTGK